MAQATKLFDLSAAVAAAPPKPVLSRPPAVFVGPPAAETQIAEPRKLVRPRMPQHMAATAVPRRLRGTEPLVRHAAASRGHAPAHAPASHAEALYFQKQMQAQTPLVFVLEDGERLQGVVEWFDRDTIKVRNTTRVLLFKRSIKYLYKAGETRH